MALLNNKGLTGKLRKGDQKAFEVIYWKYRKPLFGLAVRYLKDTDLAEDAIHDIFLKLWDSREQMDDEKSLQGFLFTALRNRVLNIIKTDKRRIIRQFEYADFHSAQISSPEEEISYSELNTIFKKGMKELPGGKRKIFRMKKIEGYSNQEIAEKLEISIHTVKSQYNKASEFLKKFVESQNGNKNGFGPS